MGRKGWPNQKRSSPYARWVLIHKKDNTGHLMVKPFGKKGKVTHAVGWTALGPGVRAERVPTLGIGGG